MTRLADCACRSVEGEKGLRRGPIHTHQGPVSIEAVWASGGDVVAGIELGLVNSMGRFRRGGSAITGKGGMRCIHFRVTFDLGKCVGANRSGRWRSSRSGFATARSVLREPVIQDARV